MIGTTGGKMATSHQSSAFELGLTLPLPLQAPLDATREQPSRLERIELPTPLSGALQEVLLWTRAKPAKGSLKSLQAHWKTVAERINDGADEWHNASLNPDLAKLVSENISVMRLALLESRAAIQNARELPFVQGTNPEASTPRPYALALAYLRATSYHFAQQGLTSFLRSVQERTALLAAEIWNLKPFLELALLEQIAEHMPQSTEATEGEPEPLEEQSSVSHSILSCAINSLSQVNSLEWKSFFESACLVESILRTDPASAYDQMDSETREAYRAAVAELSRRSSWPEAEVAQKAVALARAAEQTPGNRRTRERRSHIGFYLVDAGKATLAKEIGYRAPLFGRVRDFILKWSDVFYLVAIELAAFGVMALVLSGAHATILGSLPAVLLVLPAIECAVAAVNLLATRIFPPRKLPKLDFSKGIPAECQTAVVVPTLLSSEQQVRFAVRALEVRFLANRDANLRYCLVTDLPDAAAPFDEKEPLVQLCSSLIQQLNDKYALENKGSFFHFHRHRIFDPAEGVWMGWERKRGKLLDFNRFLLNQGDSFPVKTGDLSLLTNIRYVITLDLDTQLPPGAARRLVGALAHPLNRAVINPRTNSVVEGYGVLQPRVDINLESTNRSRFAKLLSGDTGIDIYTRAVSDVYQDLFGQGIFTGKGIYEVATFHTVLDQRFPCNLVLSHDLIEGEYIRTGLVSDIEVVDDYPSHCRAFSSRKHRWVRGDWQILFGLLPRVRNSSGQLQPNPLNHISRWKIIDNLRRSLSECATLVVLLCGWLVFPEAAPRWTLAAVAILLFPMYFPLLVAVLTAGKVWFRVEFWRSLWADFVLATYRIFVRLVFLCHQSFIDMDAILRSLVRMKFTRKKLLQWETAAEAELAGRGHGLVDFYLQCSLLFTIIIGTLIYFFRHDSLESAAPFLLLWGTAVWTAKWLNRSPRRCELTLKQRKLVRNATLRTWRFFRQFSNEQENWLIPDIVQQDPPLIAHRVSPTNLGLLFNSRQAAHDLGFLSTAEFIQQTEATLNTVRRMPRSQGHLYNWYENSTLQPVTPLFVSTVDNGNLLGSLWTLKQGCLEMLKQPLLRPAIWDGIHDHLDLLVELATQQQGDNKLLSTLEEWKSRLEEVSSGHQDQLEGLRAMCRDVMHARDTMPECAANEELAWWTEELSIRAAALLESFDHLAPWLDSRYQQAPSLSESDTKRLTAELTLESIPGLYGEVCERIATFNNDGTETQEQAAAQALLTALQNSIRYAQDLAARLNEIADNAESLVDEMDFGLLYDQKKKLFSIGLGFETGRATISTYHYDLLASEARIAVLGAIAKGEVPQETWFKLKRSYRSYKQDNVLLSWSGTAFEYLMPCLWMRAYPTTLLERGVRAAIRAQQKFAKANHVPCWGISESSCNQRNPDGHYRYHAFGVPPLALHTDDCSGDLVIAPYATLLALPFDLGKSLKNLRKMKRLGWTSPYGFYEAADFTPKRVNAERGHELVRNWMAHHQGMCMVAAANVLCDSAMQGRFHAEPRVAAIERLLHEKLPRTIPYEEETEAISKSAPALMRMAQRPHPGFRELLPKLLLKGEN